MSAVPASTSLTGVWHGQFSYPYGQPPGDFVAVLFDTAGHLSGTIHEPDETGASPDSLLYAAVDGRRSGGAVSFRKQYDGVGGWAHTVDYAGRLSADGLEIEGAWSIPGVWSGRFLMIRAAGKERAVARGAAEVVG